MTVQELPVCLVTTARNPAVPSVQEAVGIARRVGGEYTPRQDKSIAALETESDGRPVIVVESTRVVCHHRGEVFFFHPSLAKIRMHDDRNGRLEPLLQALDLRPGDRVLDATIGRAGDAILIAHGVGPEGTVIGLEASTIVAEITRIGLASYTGTPAAITTAMRRIEVLCADHTQYLRDCDSGSFDVVYFDPMFDVPLEGSNAIEPLRALAQAEPLRVDALKEARRVARRRVVVKSRRDSTALRDLGFTTVTGGRGSRLAYGIWDI